jgi:parallel beta-helix repeat protein
MLRERRLFTEGYGKMKLKAVSGIMLTLLLIGMLPLAFNIQPVKASGPIYIRVNGSIDPSTANITTVDNVTYTFTDNNYDMIIVERDNIVVDGIGYILQGTGSGTGITLSGRSNVTIKNMKINAFGDSILLSSSSECRISGNNITTNDPYGISSGIYLREYSNLNRLSGNNITVSTFGISLADYCLNNVLSGNNITVSTFGISLANYCSINILSGNYITDTYYGIELFQSSNNNILSGNHITANRGDGIHVHTSSNNKISGNNITNNNYGINLYSSSINILSGNYLVANKWDGITLDESTENTLSGNNIANNKRGMYVYSSYNNKIYHNNFFENIIQANTMCTSTWDDGYPSGGNYWSDYTGVDVYSGPNQNETGSDGIGDTVYVVNAILYDLDRYPLMYPWPPSYTLTVYSSPIGVTFTVDGVSRITSWSGTYSEGISVSLIMPKIHDGYVWSHWLEDGDTNRIKAVTMDTNITLTGVYAPAPKPVGGKANPINMSIIKPETPTLWIWLSAVTLSLIATAVFVKHKKKKQ